MNPPNLSLLLFLAKGLLLGVGIAAPVGPIGVLCIRRSLADGFRAGLATGLGAATADALYGVIAGFGLTALSQFLVAQQFWFGLLGGVFLVQLGVRTFVARPAERAASAAGGTWLSAYASTLFLTLTNPMTILSFVAVFAGLGLATNSSWAGATALVAGVFAGSTAWWLFLSGAVSCFRTRITPRTLQWINRASGVLIVVFGFYAVTTAFRR